MESRTPAEIAEAWIAWRARPGARDLGHDPVAGALEDPLPREAPLLCLAAIVEVLRRVEVTRPTWLLALLAAGPLEDLLVHNGDAVIEDVERLARQDPPFRMLLNGVWSQRMPSAHVERLAKYRADRW